MCEWNVYLVRLPLHLDDMLCCPQWTGVRGRRTRSENNDQRFNESATTYKWGSMIPGHAARDVYRLPYAKSLCKVLTVICVERFTPYCALGSGLCAAQHVATVHGVESARRPAESGE